MRLVVGCWWIFCITLLCILYRVRILHFPYRPFRTHTEFKIFSCNGIIVFVHHHNTEQVAKCLEK